MPKGKTHKSSASRSVTKRVLAPPPWAQQLTEASGVRQATSSVLGPRGVKKDFENTQNRFEDLLAATSRENREAIENNRVSSQAEMSGVGNEFDVYFEDGMDVDSEEAADSVWVDIEDQELVHDLDDFTRSRWKGRWSGYKKSWKERKAREMAAWDTVMEPLVDTYIRTVYPAPYRVYDTNECPNPATTDSTAPITEDDARYTIAVYDIWTLERELTFTRRADSTSPALELMSLGYVAKSPTRPSVAISLRTLQLLYRLRQRKASFSVEAFAKVICDYYTIPFRRYMREVVADAFEIYLRIRRTVDQRVKSALGWDSPGWRAKNACRACCYKLEGEPPLRFSRLVCMDGNNSLKRMLPLGDRTAADTRTLESDYFLSKEYVDQYAHEVKKQKSAVGPQVKTKRPGDVTDSEDEDNVIEDEEDEGDPTDGVQPSPEHEAIIAPDAPDAPNAPDAQDPETHGPDTPRAPHTASADVPLPAPLPDTVDIQKALNDKIREACVVNWKAAAADDKKKMWSIFDECGVFASACRHGFLLWLIDMIRSGELAKYPIATVAKMLTELGEALGLGYDIGCSFTKTVENSSLGELAKEKALHICVNAFHGYTHCYPCQLRFHPDITEGMGLEDLETMERIFSASNHLASITRYASPYRRRLFIEAYFKQWDEDKNLNLGSFILGNVKQALEVIRVGSKSLDNAKRTLGITDEEMSRWEDEQARFFATVGKEDPYDHRELAYVELLEQLPRVSEKRSRVVTRFLVYDPEAADQEAYHKAQVSETLKVETERRHAIEQYERMSRDIINLEIQLGIHVRWTPAHPKYQSMLKFTRERRYREALAKLQGLVVQRLFELHKLNLAQTSYKMRTHISKALQKRSKTIRRAVSAFNEAASQLSPPREPLDWKTVSEYGFLEQFNLLADTRNDIRDKRWARNEVRETMKLRNRIARAHEELQRCAIELRRLHTAIRDEPILFSTVLSRLKAANDPLYGAVKEFTEYREKVNDRLRMRIWDAYELRGFDCIKSPGIRLGSRPPEAADVPASLGLEVAGMMDPVSVDHTQDVAPLTAGQSSDEDGSSSDLEGDDVGDDQVQEEVVGFMDFVSALQ